MCPDTHVIVPREASCIMAMRGAQAHVGWYEPYGDMAMEYFRFDAKGESEVQDALTPAPRDDEDERTYWLAAAVWRGCIKGMEEWQVVRARDGDTTFVNAWERPYFAATTDRLGINQQKTK